MILRLQQFAIAQAERLGAWAESGAIADIQYDWPEETGAFEVVIADTDETGRPVSGRLRRDHLRSMIPTLAQTLRQPNEILIARIDGPVGQCDLLAALAHLPAPDAPERFALSAIEKLDRSSQPPVGSLRMELRLEQLQMLCADPGLNLETSSRLRLFCVSEALAGDVLEADQPGDECWGEILPQLSFIIQPAAAMESIQILTPRYGPADFSARISRALAGEF